MPIKRSSDQKNKSLEEFYEELKWESNPVWPEIGVSMLKFITMINDLFKTTQLWGLTSHERLVIQAEDNSESPWFVNVSALGKQYYFVYPMPTHKAPWQNATVHGVANSLEEAKKYLLIAMKESEGWKDNEEMKQLLVVAENL